MLKYFLWVLLSLGLVIGASSFGGEGDKKEIEPPPVVSVRCCAPPPDCLPDCLK